MLPLTALLAGVALLLAGSGLLGTLLAVRGSQAGFGDQALGLVMSAYFLGFLAGTFLAPPLIRRLGHIRAFAFFAALCACTVLAHPMLVAPWPWGLLRLGTGIALVGLYTAIESWLNSHAAAEHRGRIFAVYMAVNLLALALGQQLLRLAPADSFVLFSLVAILVCAAMLPVTATRLAQPATPVSDRMRVRQLARVAPAAAAGAMFSGLAMGAFWGLGPAYASHLGLNAGQVASFMSLAILGGAALQLPIGRLSDRGDRRLTLGLVCALAAALAVATALLRAPSPWLLYGLFFAYGGLAFAVYPVAVAHLLDRVPAEQVLAACSTVLLVHGAGAAVGPALAGALMQRFGPAALPAWFAAMQAAVVLFTLTRLLLRQRAPDQPAHFHPMLRTTPTALELLPETDSPAPSSPEK
ncbi:MFS transporter [Arenimonas fontis]|uniref:MFS transporter n=1 Tax=Arenimonas fontis TaxID=2608255 RepID=A0A5B2ZAE4_9GAMM|nr:MFS transporter [Arenimonas fontis]KAA2285116.1 MFS transporter [Arenimonas fontis]